MTNQWTDIMYSTLLLVFSNPYENHPGSSVWVQRALDAGANAYVIDPRRTRMADNIEKRMVAAGKTGKNIRIRPGTDIAFINGIIRYVLEEYESGSLSASRGKYLTLTYDPFVAGGLFKFDKNDGSASTWPSVSGMRWPNFTDAGMLLNSSGTDYLRYGVDITAAPTSADINYSFFNANPSEFAYATATKLPVYSGDITHSDSVFQYLKARTSAYTPDVVVDICGRVRAGETPNFTTVDFEQLCQDVVENAWAKNGAAFGDPNYRVTTILYAMGTTQHTHGSQNIRDYAILQLLCGNMGRAGGGVNALRGIGNVQGSTDMGLLKALIPNYSAPPGSTNYDAYVLNLFGNSAKSGLQQLGFKNMTYAFFHGDPTTQIADANISGASGAFMWWPGTGSSWVGGTKNQGYDHRTMFVQANSANPGYTTTKPMIKALVCLGQNPVQSESNSPIIRKGIKGLDMLAVSDMFLSETAEAEIGPYTTAYFLPAASFAEKCGTYTNSARVVQWKWQVAPPKGSSKTDLEILTLLAYELTKRNALNVNTSQAPSGVDNSTTATIWSALFASQYNLPADPWSGWSNSDYQKDFARNGSWGYAESILRQMGKPKGSGGTLWLYDGCWLAAPTVSVSQLLGVPGVVNSTYNVTQRRDITPTGATNGPIIYPKWGFAWLINRRVFYNCNGLANQTGHISGSPGDSADLIVTPDKCGRLFVHLNSDFPPTPVPYSLTYRTYFKLAEADGRTPLHWEPHESPRPDLQATYGTRGLNSLISYGSVSAYPLVLTTIRYVEHYQGGQMTRNVAFLTELVPEPMLEINSIDAANYGINDGDEVYVRTARSVWASNNGVADDYLQNYGWVGPFRAKIFTSRDRAGKAVSRVAKGVVAIPFHWGSKGANKGASANLLTNEAQDANTNMPESKSCLCQISKTITP